MSRQRVTICREGLYYLGMMLFIVAGAQIREVNLLMFIAAVMVGPLVISWRMVYVVLGKLTITRQLPDRCTAGDTLTVQLRAGNAHRRLPCWAVTLTDQVTMPTTASTHSQCTPQPVHLLLPDVPPHGEATASYVLRPMDRGRYRLGPLTMETRFPLGLIRRRVTLDQSQDLTVYPSRGRLVATWRQTLRSPREGTQQVSHRIGLLEGDFHGFRDWQAGDSRRWIHWRTSARRGQLTVCQFEQPTDEDIVLLLDLTADDGVPRKADEEAGQSAARENAIRFAATIAADVCRNASQRITVGIAGQTVQHLTGSGSVAMLHEILEQLALAQPGHPDQLSHLMQIVAPRLSARQSVWLVTPRVITRSRQKEFEAMLGRTGESNGRLLQFISVGSALFDEIFDGQPAVKTLDAT